MLGSLNCKTMSQAYASRPGGPKRLADFRMPARQQSCNHPFPKFRTRLCLSLSPIFIFSAFDISLLPMFKETFQQTHFQRSEGTSYRYCLPAKPNSRKSRDDRSLTFPNVRSQMFDVSISSLREWAIKLLQETAACCSWLPPRVICFKTGADCVCVFENGNHSLLLNMNMPQTKITTQSE